MQLSFLGQTYEVNFPIVKVSETEETATFMGQTYTRKQYQVEQPLQAPAELTFMGQRYIRAENVQQPLPSKPRPGEKVGNSRQLLQMQRRSPMGRRNPAFRDS